MHIGPSVSVRYIETKAMLAKYYDTLPSVDNSMLRPKPNELKSKDNLMKNVSNSQLRTYHLSLGLDLLARQTLDGKKFANRPYGNHNDVLTSDNRQYEAFDAFKLDNRQYNFSMFKIDSDLQSYDNYSRYKTFRLPILTSINRQAKKVKKQRLATGKKNHRQRQQLSHSEEHAENNDVRDGSKQDNSGSRNYHMETADHECNLLPQARNDSFNSQAATTNYTDKLSHHLGIQSTKVATRLTNKHSSIEISSSEIDNNYSKRTNSNIQDLKQQQILMVNNDKNSLRTNSPIQDLKQQQILMVNNDKNSLHEITSFRHEVTRIVISPSLRLPMLSTFSSTDTHSNDKKQNNARDQPILQTKLKKHFSGYTNNNEKIHNDEHNRKTHKMVTFSDKLTSYTSYSNSDLNLPYINFRCSDDFATVWQNMSDT